MTDKTPSPTDALKITRKTPTVKPKAAAPHIKEKRTNLGSGLTQVTYS